MRYFLIHSLLITSLYIQSDPGQCSLIENDSDRLSCYDNIFKKSNSSKNDNETSEVSTNLSLEEKEQELLVKERKLLEKEEELEKKEKELDSDQERKWFGFAKRTIEKEEDEEAIKIVSKIETVATKLNSQLLIILENGQHWISVEKYRRHKLKDGYDVEITRGFLSGFALRVPETKIKIRVRRIK